MKSGVAVPRWRGLGVVIFPLQNPTESPFTKGRLDRCFMVPSYWKSGVPVPLWLMSGMPIQQRRTKGVAVPRWRETVS
jgi:hypothetical protein